MTHEIPAHLQTPIVPPEPVAITPLVHAKGARPCNEIAVHATDQWLLDFAEGKAELQCMGCNQKVVWKDVETGDEYEQQTAGVNWEPEE